MLARYPGVVALILLKLDSPEEINTFSLVADRYLALRQYRAIQDHLRWLHAKAYMATRTLADVPKEKRTYLLCLAAVTRRGHALEHVSGEHLDHATQSWWALKHVPEEHTDRMLCLAAVTHDGHALLFVPEKYKDYALCLAAATQTVYALQDVPEEHRESVRVKVNHPAALLCNQYARPVRQ